MDKKSAQVFLLPRERCFERLRLARFGETGDVHSLRQ